MANAFKISGKAWDALTNEDRERVHRIVSSTGLAGGEISLGSELVPQGEALLGINFCKIGCDLGEAAAVAACASLSGPAAAVCVAAAHAAADVCRSKC